MIAPTCFGACSLQAEGVQRIARAHDHVLSAIEYPSGGAVTVTDIEAGVPEGFARPCIKRNEIAISVTAE